MLEVLQWIAGGLLGIALILFIFATVKMYQAEKSYRRLMKK